MRWFTRGWHGGSLSDARVERVAADYRNHVAELRAHLPPGVAPLVWASELVSTHDGHFISVQAPRTTPGRLIFDISCWDMAHGTLLENSWSYPDLHVRIVYDDAELLKPGTLKLLERRARNASTVILYEEIDRAPDGGAFEHRLLLWPREAGFVVVRFAHVDVTVVRFDGAEATVFPIDDSALAFRPTQV